ncbi:NHLP family bacteriocin export ABC transporter peptidase/permease/ATPase subunit [Treponema sp. UBA3813]|uniref:NHLP family bacteriocin export ABC transporter peptidase/permease/ATPase subunit n=1 Tax=Treponema sp. UBA3813 TaxID=1947715 RepID=UPI002601326D|nr:NHLP family bacteriocin export ABC transporter peptidase/permease/ATPase subunit [Treponema sp. UBA3813]
MFGFGRVKKTPTVLQMEALECGAASLAMILGYYQKYISLEVLRVDCGVSRDGTKATNILKAARKYGLEAKGFKMEVDALRLLKEPCIIFWNFNHFVVLEGFKGKNAVLNDPASGRRRVSMDEFDESFTGVVLTFGKGPDFNKGGVKPRVWHRLKKRLGGLGSIFTFLGFLSFLYFIPGFVYPTFSRFFIDEILVKNSMNLLKPLIAVMALTCVVSTVLQAIQNAVLMRFQVRLSLSSASRFIAHILKMPMQFFVQRLPGELCNRIASCDSISSLVSGQLIGVVINLFSTIFFLVLMLMYDIPLTIISVTLTSIVVIVFKINSDRIKDKSFKIEMEEGKLSGITMSGIEMIESLKASGSENDFFMQWSGQQAKVLLETQRLVKTNTGNSIVPQLISSIQGILILTVGALRVMDGHLTIGMLMAFQTLLSQFSGPINSFLGLGSSLLSANADMQRIDDVMEYPIPQIFKDDSEPQSDAKAAESLMYKPIPKLEGYISLKNITFGYSPLAAPLITDLSIEFTPGKRIALVGATGSGKSTIGKLVSGLYKPWSGEILFDKKPMQEIERKVFSSSVAVVNQSISLFEGTVKDNITMWNSTIPEEVYMQAAKDACIHDVITSRPNGYYSKVGEGGRNFSGGQRQRLEIARALATNPRIIIMDEATSALDAITEQTVDKNIRRRGCTSIIIAHRLSTIRDCDEIIVLDHGTIIERGTHDELIASGGAYKELVQTM